MFLNFPINDCFIGIKNRPKTKEKLNIRIILNSLAKFNYQTIAKFCLIGVFSLLLRCMCVCAYFVYDCVRVCEKKILKKPSIENKIV